MSISAQGLSNDDYQDSKLSHFEGESLNLVSDGDATLVVSNALDNSKRRFLVSTVVLSLASRYFDRLFNGHMAEAQKLSDGGPASVDLDEDDPRAVELVASDAGRCRIQMLPFGATAMPATWPSTQLPGSGLGHWGSG